MLKRSLKATIATIIALSTVPTGIVCSADETSVTTVATSVVETSSTDSVQTTVATTTTGVETTADTLATTAGTTEGTTTVTTTTTTEATTTSADTTTKDETTKATTTRIRLNFQPIDDLSAVATETIDGSTDGAILDSLTYAQKVALVQDEVDEYLYETTTLTPDEALKVARKYVQRVCSYADVSGSEILWLCKHANDVVEWQNLVAEKNAQLYTDLEGLLENVNRYSYSKIEENYRYLVKKAFNEQVLDSKEALTLLQSAHSTVMGRLSKWELDLVEYANYSFVSNQSLVSKWNRSYPDMQGWIYIEGSSVDYPVMQYSDNDYYLEHSWNGAESSRGTIELDYRSTLSGTQDSADSTENVLVYGHNLSDNTMFSSLVNYKKRSYYEDHQYIEVSTLEGQRLYKVYAVCSVFGLANGTKFKYWDDRYVSMDEETFNEHVRLTKSTMLYDTGDFPEFGQDVLTLQTCDGSGGWRVVVFAKRVK